jgi:hypothetical protein
VCAVVFVTSSARAAATSWLCGITDHCQGVEKGCDPAAAFRSTRAAAARVCEVAAAGDVACASEHIDREGM